MAITCNLSSRLYYFLPFTTAIKLTIILILSGLGGGLILGFAQAFALKGYIKNFSQGWWIFSTVLATLIALPFEQAMWRMNGGIIMPSLIMPSLFNPNIHRYGLVFGLVIGCSQWFVLKRYIKNAGWWIIFNTFAWPIGFFTNMFTNALFIYAYYHMPEASFVSLEAKMNNREHNFSSPYLLFQNFSSFLLWVGGSFLLSHGLMGIVIGIITGQVLLKNSLKAQDF